jgi:Homoserine dehydrogenase
MNKLNIGIAGLGNVGSALVESIEENKNYFLAKTDVEFNIVGISAKTKNKKRNFNISNYIWYDDPIEMSKDDNCNVIVELIGEEKGISYEIFETALKIKNM